MHPRLLLLPLALFALAFHHLVAPAGAPSADWPRFRGPDGDGRSADKDVPVEWTEKNVLWKTPLPGVGHSSPIVVKGNVFLLSATDDERLLVCLDARSGKERWAKKVTGGTVKIHPKSSFASSTPCSDGERVFCAFWDTKTVALYAYDFDGKQLWKRDLGAFKSQHGHGFSPIVHDGLVIVNNDQDGTSSLQAFHAKDGKPAWQTPRKPFRACYSTPVILKNREGAELLVGSTAGLSRYNPADGKEVWKFTWKFMAKKPLRTVGSLAVSEGIAFLGAGDGDGSREMVAVNMGGKGEAPKEARLWDTGQKVDTPYVPSLLAEKGHLYTITDRGGAACFEGKTGKEMWRSPRLSTYGFSASPVLIDGKIYAVDDRGTVHVVEASPKECKVLARNKLGEEVTASPAVADGKLYVRGHKHLFCVGKPE